MARNAANHRLTIVLALVLVALAVPATAHAGASTAAVDGSGTLTYTASGSDANHLVASGSGSSVTLTESGSGVTIAPGAGCTGGATSVTCSGVAALALNLGDGDNFADSSAVALPTAMDGGTGFDRLYSGSGRDNLNARGGDDWLDGGLGDDTLAGGPGTNDIVIYTSHSSAVNVSLDGVKNDGSAGESDSIGGDVEHIIGGSGNDTLTGNSGQNYISGGRGNDTINGGGGTSDFVAYWERTDPVTIDFASGTFGNQSIGESDTVDPAIAHGVGGRGNDRLTGDGRANILWGGWSGIAPDGDDWLQGRGGTDTYWGGEGSDTVDYGDKTSAVYVTIDDNNDDADGDNVRTDVENVTGGPGNDTLIGNSGPNVLDGALGNDSLTGGGGIDTLSYASHSFDVTASLASGSGGQTGETDTFSGFENLTGGAGADTLTGDGNANRLDGGLGPDLLYGGAGDDVFAARDGALDGLTCGTGSDSGLADADDTVAADCESVEKSSPTPPPPGPPPPTTDSTTTTTPPPTDSTPSGGQPTDDTATTDPAPKDGLTGPINLEPPVVPGQTAPVSAKGVARVAIECPADAGSCKGTVILRLLERVKAKERTSVVAARRRRTTKIGRARFRADAGTKPIVRVRLNKRGRRRVLRNRRRRAGRCRARVVVKTRTAAGELIKTSGTITLRARRAARTRKRG